MTKKKIIFRALTACLVCLLVLAQLVACGDGHKMIYKDGMYYIRATGSYYKVAPLNYMPIGKGDEPYARYKVGEMTEYYYKIAANVAAEDYLALVFEDYVSGLMYSSEITLPNFREFEANRILIATNSDIPVSVAEIATADGIDAILDAFECGEKVEYPASEALETYRLIFCSEKYPAFNMTLRFYHYGEGRTYIYNIGTRDCRVVDDAIIEEYLPDDEMPSA